MSRTLGVLLALAIAFPSIAQRHPNVAKGFDPGKTQFTGEIDSINYFNGNLTLSIPIGQTFPLSTRLGYQLSLQYNSTVWDFEEVERDIDPDDGCDVCFEIFTAAYPDRRSNAGFGWSMSLGRLYAPWAVTNESERWLYESADGSEHAFFDKLRETDTPIANTWYTRDGTYLRMRIDAATGRRLIEFPDGRVQEFEEASAGKWRLRMIRDGFKNGDGTYANRLEITYGSDSQGAYWRLDDSVGRTHWVRFESRSYDGATVDFVKTIQLAAFGTDTATYTFTYSDVTTVRPCHDTDKPAYGGTLAYTRVPALTEVKLTNNAGTDLGRKFDFSQWVVSTSEKTCADYSGVMTSAGLPGRGNVAWTWSRYDLPVLSASEVYFQSSWGVATRTLNDRRGNSGTWTHTHALDRLAGNTQDDLPREKTQAVVDPAGNKTEYFFNVAADANDAWEAGHYALPFSPVKSDGTNSPRYMSSRVHSGNDNPVRWSYVRYEHDTGTSQLDDPKNMRVVSSRTSHDENESSTASALVHEDMTQSDFDGLGHYRTTTTDGTFGSANVKTVHTKYNAPLDALPGHFQMPAPNDPWILKTYSQATVTEGASQFIEQYCFDPSGTLLRKRTLAGATVGNTDVLDVFEYDAHGNLKQHDTYGGDGAALPISDQLCDLSLPTRPAYRTTHAYSGGVLASSAHVIPSTGATMPFKTLDLTIDIDTGLPSSSSDTAGAETTYTYDAAGRPKSIQPQGELASSFTYSNATFLDRVFTPATVAATAGSGTSSIESAYQFDGLGRLWREKQLMPDGTWSVRETTYDGSGRVTATSELEKLVVPAGGTEFDFIPAHATFFSNYDAFGRARQITAPDGSIVDHTFSGIRKTSRTHSVWTDIGAQNVTVTEEYDRQGRLWKVRENATSATAWVETTYAYDAAGRITSVATSANAGATQPARTFTYDGRGFLTSETHPESGTTSYEYDARGHVTKRTTPVATLTFTYDAAERLEKVVQAGLGTLKEFFYDRTNTSTDWSMGKLDYAVRHNHQPLLGGNVTVTETYRYNGVGGRLGKKETDVSTGQKFVQSYAFDTLGLPKSVTYPKCESGCTGLSEPSRTVNSTFTHGVVGGVTGYAGSIQYHPNGMLASIRHTNVDLNDGPLYRQDYDGSNGMARPAGISVSDFCKGLEVTQHPQNATITKGQRTQLNVVTNGASSWQWYAGNQAITGATGTSVEVQPSVTTSYWVRATDGSCSVDSAAATVTVMQCVAPDPAITAPASIVASASGSASVVPVAGATYTWTVNSSPAGTGSSITFRAQCSGNVTVSVTATADCGESSSSSVQIPITPPTAWVSGSTTINQGGSAPIQAALTGTGPWDLTWSDGVPQNDVASSPASRSAAPDGTTTYTLTAVTDQYGCAATTSGSATVTVIPPTPTRVTATAASTSAVNVTWSFSGIADSFEIERYDRAAGSPASYRVIGSSTGQSFTNTALPSATSFLYRVRAVKSGTRSAASAADVATTIVFSDDSVIAGATILRAVHLAEMRTAVNAMRTLAQLQPASFTDATLSGVVIQRVHIDELRSALAAARSALSLAAIGWTDSPLAAGTPVRAVHMNEIRGGVQ